MKPIWRFSSSPWKRCSPGQRRAGEHRVGEDAVAAPPTGRLLREQDVGALRLGVGHTGDVLARLPLEIVELHRHALVRGRAHHDDPRAALGHLRVQPKREREMAEVIGREPHVEPVGEMRVGRLGHARVRDQQVDRPGDRVGEGRHRVRGRADRVPRRGRAPVRVGREVAGHRFACRDVAHTEHDVGAREGEPRAVSTPMPDDAPVSTASRPRRSAARATSSAVVSRPEALNRPDCSPTSVRASRSTVSPSHVYWVTACCSRKSPTMPAAPAAAFITWNVDSAVSPRDRLGPPVLGLERDRHVLTLGGEGRAARARRPPAPGSARRRPRTGTPR